MSRAAQDVADLWAAHNEYRTIDGVKPRAFWRKGNVSFDGPRFTSYSTVVAMYHKKHAGPQFVLISENRYSPTTARHLSSVAWALQQEYVFYVPWVDPRTEIEWHDNAVHLKAQIGLAEQQALAGWKHTWEDWQKQVMYAYRRASDYIHLTGVPLTMEPLNLILDSVNEARQDKLHTFNHPARVKARERALARRLALKALNLS